MDVTFADGSTVNLTRSKLFMCLADRMAFEARFGFPCLPRIKANVDADTAEELPETWTAFFTWRELRRQRPTTTLDSFDAWCETLASIEADQAEVRKAVELGLLADDDPRVADVLGPPIAPTSASSPPSRRASGSTRGKPRTASSKRS